MPKKLLDLESLSALPADELQAKVLDTVLKFLGGDPTSHDVPKADPSSFDPEQILFRNLTIKPSSNDIVIEYDDIAMPVKPKGNTPRDRRKSCRDYASTIAKKYNQHNRQDQAEDSPLDVPIARPTYFILRLSVSEGSAFKLYFSRSGPAVTIGKKHGHIDYDGKYSRIDYFDSAGQLNDEPLEDCCVIGFFAITTKGTKTNPVLRPVNFYVDIVRNNGNLIYPIAIDPEIRDPGNGAQ